MKDSVAAIVLTKNEELHIERCLNSISNLANEIHVVDSFSTDQTELIARTLGANFVQNPWSNHANQFNWALDNLPIKAEWIVRIDADEILADDSSEDLLQLLFDSDLSVAGFTVNRRIIFLGHWIRHGSVYPMRSLRIFRKGRGRCEERWMDEHIVVSGEVKDSGKDIVDHNLNSLSWWTEKHNNYASREVADSLMGVAARSDENTSRMSVQAGIKRWIKVNAYQKLPLGIRPILYWIYRYFLRLGFLDGWQGFLFHSLQGGWYRMLVDAKTWETRQYMSRQNATLQESLRDLYGLEISQDSDS